MAVVAGLLNETQRRTREALCDTFAPSVAADGEDPLMREFLARAATDLGVPGQIEGLMADSMLPEDHRTAANILAR